MFRLFLLRWNSHDIKRSHFKINQWHFIHSQHCSTTIHFKFKNIFLFHKDILYLTTSRFWQPSVCSLSLWVCLFWIFLTNGLIQYVTFWLLSLNTCSGFIHFVPCIRITLLFYVWMTFHYILIPQFIHPFISELFSSFGYCEYCCYRHLCTCIWVPLCNSFVFILGVKPLGHTIFLCLTLWGTF